MCIRDRIDLVARLLCCRSISRITSQPVPSSVRLSRIGFQLENKQEARLSLVQPTVLVVVDLQGQTRSMIVMSFDSQYATSY